MFQSSPFNQDISSWDLSTATAFADMFGDASEFNQNLCDWEVYLVQQDVVSVSDMFAGTACPNTADPAGNPISSLCYGC